MLEKIIALLTHNLPEPLSLVQAELKAHLEKKLTDLFAEAIFVSREEFTVQMSVLQKTRAKLELLEKKIADQEQEV